MRFTTLALEKHDHVGEIRLARPEMGNPVDEPFFAELDAAVEALHDDTDIYVVLLTAEGDVFSSGRPADPSAMPHHPELPFRRLETIGPPVIAVLHGNAVGAGLELALACDIRVAAEGAMFALPDVGMGMLPCHGATQRLPRLVGRAKAAEMILLGEAVGARDALSCGLVNAVAPAGRARDEAMRIAAAIASRGPAAVRLAKEAVLRGLDLPLEQALRYETDLTIILQTTDDRAEGVSAFLEKRPPRFEGR
jgi:enoyl-CoA hydratase/carnithine racemase